jgi:hypothetical protein
LIEIENLDGLDGFDHAHERVRLACGQITARNALHDPRQRSDGVLRLGNARHLEHDGPLQPTRNKRCSTIGLSFFTSLPLTSLDKISLQKRLDKFGKTKTDVTMLGPIIRR